MLIYADTASLSEIERLDEDDRVAGFTTNPSIFKAEGVTDPEAHAKEIIRLTAKPVSIDGPPEKVWALGPNAIPKVFSPKDTKRSGGTHIGLNINVTAVTDHVPLGYYRPGDIVSVFAGRILDTGRSPVDSIAKVGGLAKRMEVRVLWASCREPYNIRMAEEAGCDIITVPPAMLEKWWHWQTLSLAEVHALTVEQFERDRIDW